jgi:hypothetical protein
MTSLITGYDVKIGREYIDDFALSFVSPLRSYNHYILHNNLYPDFKLARAGVSQPQKKPDV